MRCCKRDVEFTVWLNTKKFSFSKKIFVSCYFQYVYLPFETIFFVLKIPEWNYREKIWLWTNHAQIYHEYFTVPSLTLFSKTIVDDFCEWTIRQKSLIVFGKGLCVAMK